MSYPDVRYFGETGEASAVLRRATARRQRVDRRHRRRLPLRAGRIPLHTPEWTNHDVSDPGVTLLDLFAFLGENLVYRLRPDYFDGRRLQPDDLAAEQCYLRGKRWLLWTVCGVSCAALLLVVAARRRAKAQRTEAQEEG